MVNIHEAKSTLSKLIERVENGEEIILARAGKPVAMLVPFVQKSVKRPLGLYQNKITLAPDWEETPQDITDSFYQSTGPDITEGLFQLDQLRIAQKKKLAEGHSPFNPDND